MSETTGTFEEWRVTGNPGQGYEDYDFTWSPLRNPPLGDPEALARQFINDLKAENWDEGPYLSHRTIVVGPWVEA